MKYLMIKHNTRHLMFFLIILLWTSNSSAESCEIVSVSHTSPRVYRINIDGMTHRLSDAETVAKLAETLANLENQLKEKNNLLNEGLETIKISKKLIANYDEMAAAYKKISSKLDRVGRQSLRLNNDYRSFGETMVVLAEEYQTLVKEYDELAKKYRDLALRKKSNFSWNAGIGVNNSEETENFDLIIGVEGFGLHGWFYGNPDQQGIAIGKRF